MLSRFALPVMIIFLGAAAILTGSCGGGEYAAYEVPENLAEMVGEPVGYDYVDPQERDTDGDGDPDC
jgi:hypothetical protein